ncbi:hydantoinase/oxoprolinase family protein [Aliiroseovarius crassostreae]|uniref:caprolactamase subunit alpha n=1 Tax=Aliiroseovarius crassostreae TaxID=154981 RepID=UPI0022082912|nr:hydantoinase/oxoprolinase family protein [Aliiroseovarius crassostreae]UWP88312.1 hydantoinase/oxoprolinase family protein [Aliiroseovarius crassostreae]UWP91471.1 hydantoinase/oxoprolinase family protein [Aliiroseovarius crassostreae]UWP97790.1 hydantoinase/oxoprolinase family protein [Aliiroseovarius crassostreae]UWQ07241.1 hydantoinase/oxoprolinase family protein [Aliiroseovarius crassostreae]UWQ10350.1 hydantoinase/oxoprolinase family protein [Aliiroseovarius crassostreae]
MRTQYRLGIDAGGTFTDFILADKEGSTQIFKVLSTPTEPTKAIKNGLALITEETGLTAQEIVSNSDLCINGTTVGLNALITHTGAKTGLIATRGHEDSIEIRLGHKEDGYRYDPDYPPATMLVPRHLRKGVSERVISNGAVKTPIHEEDVREACRYFIAEGVESVAISFVWSVLHPEHELRAAEIVREMMPDVRLTIGSQLYPQVREYTRTSTAIVNAYLAPILQRYVEAIDAYFRELGSQHPVRYFQSNGGLALGKVVSDQSVYAINSGPASAPQAALDVAEPWGDKNIITCDMGGTSFDITLTKDGQANVNKNIDFLRYRIGIPMIQVETLGAGGGSIGWIDSMGLMQMGPQSAGSEPGPACYGQGGENPTTTDANLTLGYLNADGLVGGRLPLDVEKARGAIQSKLADPLGISVEKAAYGMFTIVNNNMVNAIRRVSVERGYDPRDFVLMGAGGATGAHITALAREMGISKVLISKLASGLCAYGQIISDVKYNYMAPAPIRLEGAEAAEKLDTLFKSLEERGQADLAGDGFSQERISIRRSLDMRYVGQVHECTVEIDPFDVTEATLEDIKAAFHARHKELYTYDEPMSAVEVVNVESTIAGHVDKPKRMTIAAGKGAHETLKGTRPMVFNADGIAQDTPVYDGAAMGAGDTLHGPAVIEEVTTTIVVEPGWTVSLHETGVYVMTADAQAEDQQVNRLKELAEV